MSRQERLSGFLELYGDLPDHEFLEAVPWPVLLEEGHLDCVEDAADRRILRFRSAPLTLGRGKSSDLVVLDTVVSSRHAEFRKSTTSSDACEGWLVVDLGSTNGTTVDGRRLPVGEPARLEDKSVVGFGSCRFAFLSEATLLRVVRQIQFGSRLPGSIRPYETPTPKSKATSVHVRPAAEVLSGELGEVALLDLLRDIESRQLSGRLVLHPCGETEPRWISFRVGQPHAAESRGLSGVTAIRDLLNVSAGRYAFQLRTLPRGRSRITTRLSEVLLAVERRRARQAQALSQAQFRGAFESAFHGLCNCTSDGRVVSANRRCLEMFGYSLDELLGENLGRLFETLESGTEVLVDHNIGIVRELEGRRKVGETFPMEVALSRFEVEGEITWTVAVRDISDRKEAERALHQAELALQHSQKMDALGRMAAGIAHDFNNYLSVINGYSSLVLDSLPEESPLRKRIAAIGDAGGRAADLTEKLLVMCRRREITLRETNLTSVLEGLEDMLVRLIGPGIELEILAAPSLGRVLVDKGQFEQVLMNLAVNARDAMPDGGRLMLAGENVELGEERDPQLQGLPAGRYVRMTVSDDGLGMSQETVSKIFEPFYTTKAEGKGTGLGLAIVYGIIKQSKGLIVVRSHLGAGTSFAIYLPRLPDQGLPPRPSARFKRSGGTDTLRVRLETILVVDDHAPIRELVKDALGGLGYHVLTAADGDHALRVCEEHGGRIDLVLTDVRMPRMSGIELAATLDALHPEIKLVLMSAEDPPADAAGLPFLAKPFSPASLHSRIGEVLDAVSE